MKIHIYIVTKLKIYINIIYNIRGFKKYSLITNVKYKISFNLRKSYLFFFKLSRHNSRHSKSWLIMWCILCNKTIGIV